MRKLSLRGKYNELFQLVKENFSEEYGILQCSVVSFLVVYEIA